MKYLAALKGYKSFCTLIWRLDNYFYLIANINLRLICCKFERFVIGWSYAYTSSSRDIKIVCCNNAVTTIIIPCYKNLIFSWRFKRKLIRSVPISVRPESCLFDGLFFLFGSIVIVAIYFPTLKRLPSNFLNLKLEPAN